MAAALGLALWAMPAPAYAHAFVCSEADFFTTLGISGAIALALLRPWRTTHGRRRVGWGRLALPLLLAVVVTGGACGGKSSPAANRPATTARLQIVDPTPNQTTPPDITLRLNLLGARVVPNTVGPLRPDEGHIHVSLDGQLVSMAYGTTQDLHGLKPGPHQVQAEFVAIDHQPFRNRVIAFVLFRVGG
jgi:hypothetical protein